ncbi:hypothetical protein LPJ61_003976 [Coemansia biformis]|uniref:Calreticulin n=1 Tax=Coemansia biformis TaxID=1286918 RepID=A0A9W7YA77_9FUNG|nr:hypothetical protein LPJ61_003976 [Coemansia biformis]
MRCSLALAAVAALAGAVVGRVYYEETFVGADSVGAFKATEVREDIGAIKRSSGKWFGDEEAAAGLQLVEDARFYAYTTKLKRPFNTKGKDFVLQFTVKYEQDIDCGGAYLKLLPPTLDPAKFDGESEYEIMFGPDICGSTNRRVHAIINYNGTNNQIDKVIQPRGDQLTHQYTFWVKPDKTFEVRIDNKVQEEGKVEDFWKVLPEKLIADPSAEKPEDWVDGPVMIEDPEDEKPADWVDGPETIPDADAKKPEDWDDDMDGDWEPPMVANPEYKGEWKARMIKNPEYKGEWTAPLIDNPEYEEDEDLAVFNVGYVGLDIWTVKSGTIFSNILITDDIDYASQFGNSTWADHVEAEIAAKKAVDEAEASKLEEEREAKEAEAKAEEKEEKEEASDAPAAADDLDEDDTEVPAAEKKRDVTNEPKEDPEVPKENPEEPKDDSEEPKEAANEPAEEDAEAAREAEKQAKKTAKREAAKRSADKAKKAAEKAKKLAEAAAEAAKKAEEAEADLEDDDKAVHDEL